MREGQVTMKTEIDASKPAFCENYTVHTRGDHLTQDYLLVAYIWTLPVPKIRKRWVRNESNYAGKKYNILPFVKHIAHLYWPKLTYNPVNSGLARVLTTF